MQIAINTKTAQYPTLTYAHNVRTMKMLGFEWDEESKAGIDFRRHGVRMPEAIPVFDDPYAITITDP